MSLCFCFLLLPCVSLSIQVLYLRPFAQVSVCFPSIQGAEVTIIQSALQTQNLSLSLDYEITCISPDSDPVDVLTSHPEAAIFGGIVIRSEKIREGMEFSVPTFKSGMNILRRKEKETGVWDVFSPLSIGVWMLFLVTPVLVGICNFGYFVISSADRKTAVKDVKTLEKYMWIAWSRLFFNRSEPAEFGWMGLTVLIVTARLFLLCYICAKAALEYQRSQDRLLTIADVSGQRAYVPDHLRPYVAEVPYLPYPLGSDSPVELLKDSEILVYIDDHAVLCDLEDDEVEVSTQVFQVYVYGVMLGQEVSTEFKLALNTGLTKLRESTRVVDVLENAGLVKLTQKAKTHETGVIEAWGVFSILTAFLILSLCLSVLPFSNYFSPLWRLCLPRTSTYSLSLQVPDLTNRTEMISETDLPVPSHKASTTSVSFTLDDLTRTQPADPADTEELVGSSDTQVSEETIEVVRTTTLMLLLFEASFAEGLERFARLVENEESKKTHLREIIRDFN